MNINNFNYYKKLNILTFEFIHSTILLSKKLYIL